MGINFIGDLVKGARGIIDELHTSGEEKAEARRKVDELHLRATEQLLDYERARIHESAETIRAESVSGGALARNWRPVVMLVFAGMMVAHWLGLTPDSLSEAQVMKLMEIVQLGLGGYVIGRSAEKVLPAVVRAAREK